ncbi:hypothetical protein [Raoultella ornithinolytica]|uniref:hypothetical protein n=1 Tax=Raoultella ornithinolytica TaxID=54291 RepID=UPI003890C327
MKEYPSYVPVEFIMYYNFEFISETEKPIARKMIFDERMAFIWSALGKRASEVSIPLFFYQSLVLSISSFVDGPNNWELLTQKEKQNKIKKILNLSEQLSNELIGSPLDEMVTDYFNDKFYIDWFLKNSTDENAKKRVGYYLDKYFHLEGRVYIINGGVDFDFSSVWMAAGISAPSLSGVLQDLHIKSKEFNISSIIKRKTNPKKSYFIRSLAGFFEQCFGQKLYGITATLSSVFLEEDVTQEDVVSITK